MSAPKIRTTRHYSEEWTAIDEDTYDGPGSLMGFGATEAEAIADLLEQIEEAHAMTSIVDTAALRALVEKMDGCAMNHARGSWSWPEEKADVATGGLLADGAAAITALLDEVERRRADDALVDDEAREAAQRILDYWGPDYGNEDEVIVARALLAKVKEPQAEERDGETPETRATNL